MFVFLRFCAVLSSPWASTSLVRGEEESGSPLDIDGVGYSGRSRVIHSPLRSPSQLTPYLNPLLLQYSLSYLNTHCPISCFGLASFITSLSILLLYKFPILSFSDIFSMCSFLPVASAMLFLFPLSPSVFPFASSHNPLSFSV